MQPADKTKLVTFDDQAHQSLHAGVEAMRKAVGSTYGPGGRNVLIKKKYVQPILTRDGVTVARDIAGYGNRLKDDIATQAAQLVYQASEKTNKTAGDGTTATVVELAALYKEGYRRIVAGDDPMAIKRILDSNRDAVLAFINSKSRECTKDMLLQVATISSGDPELAKLIAGLVWEIGADGAITISYHNSPHVEVEKVTGYLFDQGFRHMQGESELDNPMILVSQKRLASRGDIIPVLEEVVRQQRQFILVADVGGAALETLIGAIQKGTVDGIPLPPPAYGADGHDYFEDIATYTGARLIMEADNFKDIKPDDFGSVKRARLSREQGILFGDNSQEEAINTRLGLIKQQMSKDMTPSLKETLETRYAKLAGKVSIIKVGAATEVEREELFFRVEDAVEACKSALSSGVVAGGATTLLFASEQNTAKNVPGNGLEPFVREALQAPFRLLMSNAGEDGGYRLQQTLAAGYGKGFNLRKMTDKPVDLYTDGIVDATKVVSQTVKNAFSVAGALLTTGTVITEVESDSDAKQD